jgi:hypothetical protein
VQDAHLELARDHVGGFAGAKHVHHSVTELATGLDALRPDLELLELEPGQLRYG